MRTLGQRTPGVWLVATLLVLAPLGAFAALAQGNGEEKVTICHYPPGNPENAHTITVGRPAVDAHMRNHGDTEGPCPEETAAEDEPTEDEPDEPCDCPEDGETPDEEVEPEEEPEEPETCTCPEEEEAVEEEPETCTCPEEEEAVEEEPETCTCPEEEEEVEEEPETCTCPEEEEEVEDEPAACECPSQETDQETGQEAQQEAGDNATQVSEQSSHEEVHQETHASQESQAVSVVQSSKVQVQVSQDAGTHVVKNVIDGDDVPATSGEASSLTTHSAEAEAASLPVGPALAGLVVLAGAALTLRRRP